MKIFNYLLVLYILVFLPGCFGDSNESKEKRAEEEGVLTFVTEDLKNGFVGQYYSSMIKVVGGYGDKEFKLIGGKLPNGTLLNKKTGVVSGTPTNVGIFTFSVKVEDERNDKITDEFSIEIENDESALDISGTTEDVDVGDDVNTIFTASGGLEPYEWSVESGNLPPGLSLGVANGVLSGTATTAGDYSFVVKAEDMNGEIGMKTFNIEVADAYYGLTIDTDLSDGVINEAYEAQMTVEDGLPPYFWELESGDLPTGVTLNNDTGFLSGVLSAAGVYSFDIKVVDAANEEGIRSYQVEVTD
ncbi:MAG: Ig domain-containing protein [Minisyncoccales bacterium]